MIKILIKTGSSRIVIIFNNFVIKFPKNRIGFIANTKEHKNYKYHYSIYFAKLYLSFPFGLFNIMQKAIQPKNFNEKLKNRYYNRYIKNNVYLYAVDNCIDNYGFINKHLVLIDYA